MSVKKKSGAVAWVDPDDAPAITDAFFDEAEIFHEQQTCLDDRMRAQTDRIVSTHV